MTDLKPLKEPRRLGPVARAIVDLLQNYGITGARFYKTKHFRVEFEVFEETVSAHFACTPRDDGRAARIVTRRIERQIIEAIGRAP